MKTTPKDYTFKYDKKPFKVRDGEPWFAVRAQDQLSTETVQFYADLLKRESDKALAAGNEKRGDELLKQALGVLRVGQAFADWQLDNKELVKLIEGGILVILWRGWTRPRQRGIGICEASGRVRHSGSTPGGQQGRVGERPRTIPGARS